MGNVCELQIIVLERSNIAPRLSHTQRRQKLLFLPPRHDFAIIGDSVCFPSPLPLFPASGFHKVDFPLAECYRTCSLFFFLPVQWFLPHRLIYHELPGEFCIIRIGKAAYGVNMTGKSFRSLVICLSKRKKPIRLFSFFLLCYYSLSFYQSAWRWGNVWDDL